MIETSQMVGLNEVKWTKGWILNMYAGPCVSIIAKKWDIWVMGHLVSPDMVADIRWKMMKKLQLQGINIDDCQLFMAWGANKSQLRIWEQNVSAIKLAFNKKIRETCVGWDFSRYIKLDVAKGVLVVDKIASLNRTQKVFQI